MTAIQTARHLEMKCIERRRGEARMQSELEMRRQLRLMILERKKDRHLAVVDLVSEIERNAQRIFRFREIIGRDPIGQRSGFVRSRFDQAPRFRAQKTMCASLDFLSAIQTTA